MYGCPETGVFGLRRKPRRLRGCPGFGHLLPEVVAGLEGNTLEKLAAKSSWRKTLHKGKQTMLQYLCLQMCVYGRGVVPQGGWGTVTW